MPQDNEKLKLLHSALSKDEVFNEVVPENYNEFLSVYSDPEKLRVLHSAMSKDEVFREVVPADFNEAIKVYGLGKPSAPAGASSVPAGGGVSPVPSVSGGGGGVRIPEGGTVASADGVAQMPQVPDSLISEQERQEFGLKPGEEQKTDRQRRADEVRARDQRIGREKEATLAFMRNNIGADLSEKILRNQPLTFQEGKELREMAVKSGVQGWVDVVDRMSLNSPRDAVRDFMLGADGKAAKFGSLDAFDAIVAEKDKSEIARIGQQKLAEVSAIMERRYPNAQQRERVMRNEESGLGYMYLSDSERKLAELSADYRELLNSERPNRAKLAEVKQKIMELSDGVSGTLYDPETGAFLSGNELPNQDVVSFNDEVSSLTEEYSSGKTPYQVLLDMRRAAYFAMQSAKSRYEEADQRFAYGINTPSYQREVAPIRETYREALKQFLALNRALELNIDPGAEGGPGFREGLASGLKEILIPKFMEGSPDQLLGEKTFVRSTQSRRNFVEGVTTVFQQNGIELTPGQEDALDYSFSEQAGQAIGSTFGIAIKMAAMSYGVNKIKYVIDSQKYARVFQAIMGEKFGNTGKVAANIAMSIGNMLEGSFIYETAGSNVFQGAGERASDMLYHRLTGKLFKGNPGSRLHELFFQMGRTATGVGGQVTAEYVGQFVTNLATLGVGNWQEIVETTFGSTGDEATDKLLLTILAVLPLQGAGDLGKFLAIGFRPNLEAAMRRYPNHPAVQEAMALINEVEGGNNPAFQSPSDAIATVESAAKAEVETDIAPETEVSATGLDATVNPALESVEATADALSGDAVAKVSEEVGRLFPVGQESQVISEAYHSAKSKPEASRTSEDVALIESVESVLTSKTETDAVQEQVTAEGVVGKESEVSEGVGAQVTEGGEVAGEGVTEAQTQAETEAQVEGALSSVEATARALDGKTEGVMKEPTAERKLDDVSNGRLVTFTYKNESEVPLVLRDKVSSRGYVNGQQTISVTLTESEAQYLLNKDNAQAISESYHAAKSKPEASRTSEDVALIEAVESLLGKQTAPTTKPATTEADVEAKVDDVEVAPNVKRSEVEAARTRKEDAAPTERVETVEGEGVVLYERVAKDGKREYKAKPGTGRAAKISKSEYESRVTQIVANRIAMDKMGVKPIREPKLNSPEVTLTDANLANTAANLSRDSDGNVDPELSASIKAEVDALAETALRPEDGEVDASEVDAVSDAVFNPDTNTRGLDGKDAVVDAKKKFEDSLKRLKELRKRHKEERDSFGVAFDAEASARRMFEFHQELFTLAQDYFALQNLQGNRVGALRGFAEYKSEVVRVYGRDLAGTEAASAVIAHAYDIAMAEALDPNFDVASVMPTDAASLVRALSESADGDALIEGTVPQVASSKQESNFARVMDKFVQVAFDRGRGIVELSNTLRRKLKDRSVQVSLDNFIGAVSRWRNYDTRVKLAWKNFSRGVYGGLTGVERAVLDTAIMATSVLSLEAEVQKRIDSVNSFDSALSDAVDATGNRDLFEGSKDGLKGALRRLALGRQTLDEQAAWESVASQMNLDVSQLRSRLVSRNKANKRNEEVLGDGGFINHGRFRSASGKVVVMNADYANRFMDALQNSEKYKNIRERVMPRVDRFFEYQNELLLTQREEGSVSAALYESLEGRKYVTRSFSREDAQFLIDAGVVPKNSFTETQGGSMRFWTLKGGSDGFINMNTQSLAYMNTVLTYRRIARQGALRSFAVDMVPLLNRMAAVNVDAAIAAADKAGSPLSAEQVAMLQYANTRGYVQRPDGRNEFGEPKFKKLSPMMQEALSDAVAYDLMDGSGNPIRVYIAKDIVADVDAYAKGNRVVSVVGGVMSVVLGTAIVKIQATGMNPAYALAQLMADPMHRATASDAYTKEFFSSVGMALYGGASRTAVDISQRVYNTVVGIINKDLKVKRRFEVEFEDAVNHGFNMMTLVGEAFINPVNKALGARFGETRKVMELVGYLPEVTEIAGRLDVYTRLTKRYVAQYRKREGKEPDAAQLRKMKQDAAEAANEIMDYSRTGTAKPIFESIAAFYSAAMAAYRGQVRGFKKQGAAVYTLKVAEMIGAATLLAIARKKVEEEDRRKGIETGVPIQMLQRGFYIAVSVGEGDIKDSKRRNYFVFNTLSNYVTGGALTAGELLADIILGRTSDDALMEGQRRVDYYDFMRVLTTMGPLGAPGLPPAATARSIFVNNYNLFFGSEVWRGEKNLSPYMKADAKTHVMFQQMARYLPDDSPGGAKQLQEAVSSILVANNPTTTGLYNAVDFALDMFGVKGTPGVGTKTKSPYESLLSRFIVESRPDFKASKEAALRTQTYMDSRAINDMSEQLRGEGLMLAERAKNMTEVDVERSVFDIGKKYAVDVIKDFKSADDFMSYLTGSRLRFVGDAGSYGPLLYRIVSTQLNRRFDDNSVNELVNLISGANENTTMASNLMNSIIYMGLFDPEHGGRDDKGLMGALYRLNSNFDSTPAYKTLLDRYRSFTKQKNDFLRTDGMRKFRESFEIEAAASDWATPEEKMRMYNKITDLMFVIRTMGMGGGVFE